ncbi:MAG: hypothetical protein KDN19_16690 [Verrucomicrobiae bacterium]|nr:hypothetical protein [Verrucomicrobiae bacterium]
MFPLSSFRGLKPPIRVALLLGLLATGFFAFWLTIDPPWEGQALTRTARGLEIAESEVPRSVFRDFETLGSLNLGVDAYRQIGLWYGSLSLFLALAAAALTAVWWVPLAQRKASPPSLAPSSLFAPKRKDWIGLVLLLILAAAFRAPYLDRALYFDEQDNLRRNFHGHLEIRQDGEEIWRGAGWQEAFFENRLGNNPVLLSVACQASLRAWRAISGAHRQQFDIVALRLPVFLAGLASIAALWWLLQLWGLRFSAAFAAGLAAIHPMHIDYSLQARGYALVLLFVPLALGFAWLAIRRDRWRDWFALAFAVFFCLWSYAGSVYFALALNLGIFGWLIRERLRSGDPAGIGPIARFLCVNAITGLLYVLLIFPHLPQVSYHFRNVFELIPLQAFWLFYAWSHYSTGTNFPSGHDIFELRTDAVTLPEVLFQRFAAHEPILVALQWLVIPTLIVIAFWWLRKLGRPDRSSPVAPAGFLLLLGMAAPVLALIHQQFTSLYFYYWYLSYALPVIIAAIAIGFHRLVLPLLEKKPVALNRTVATAALSLAFFALFFWQVKPGAENKPNRLHADTPWPLNEEGEPAVEFRRGRSHWIATQDGQSISLKNHYDKQEEDGERARAGR